MNSSSFPIPEFQTEISNPVSRSWEIIATLCISGHPENTIYIDVFDKAYLDE